MIHSIRPVEKPETRTMIAAYVGPISGLQDYLDLKEAADTITPFEIHEFKPGEPFEIRRAG